MNIKGLEAAKPQTELIILMTLAIATASPVVALPPIVLFLTVASPETASELMLLLMLAL